MVFPLHNGLQLTIFARMRIITNAACYERWSHGNLKIAFTGSGPMKSCAAD